MIRRHKDMSVVEAVRLKNGNGEASIINILETGEMYGAGRLFCITKMKPGVSSGAHTHTGDFETYYILKGQARVNDNGTYYELGPGICSSARTGIFTGLKALARKSWNIWQ
ncbi:cupin domain-containing protein [Oscillospiraceae bacterium 50-16]